MDHEELAMVMKPEENDKKDEDDKRKTSETKKQLRAEAGMSLTSISPRSPIEQPFGVIGDGLYNIFYLIYLKNHQK